MYYWACVQFINLFLPCQHSNSSKLPTHMVPENEAFKLDQRRSDMITCDTVYADSAIFAPLELRRLAIHFVKVL